MAESVVLRGVRFLSAFLRDAKSDWNTRNDRLSWRNDGVTYSLDEWELMVGSLYTVTPAGSHRSQHLLRTLISSSLDPETRPCLSGTLPGMRLAMVYLGGL